MPPKKAAAPATSKKTEQKKKEKVIEDKTFGLKNKKGAKQQKFIQQVEKQVKTGGQHPANLVDANAKKLEKQKKLDEKKELAMLFKPVQSQKVEKGADPKTVLCAFFKQGQCTKGDKCKFSHDLSIERKSEKRSLYVDMRDEEDENEDSMKNWDEEKLKEVIDKHDVKNKPITKIVCKYFLEAVEKSLYGWFWQCPSGDSCKYRHALPPGYVLKKDKKKEDKSEISLEELIERERAALGANQTKITLETFVAWKKRKIFEREENARKEEERKRCDYKAGKQSGLSGREMFSFNPELANQFDDMEDGDEAVDSNAYKSGDEDETSESNFIYKELNFETIGLDAQEVDDSGTKATEDRFENYKKYKERSNNVEQNGITSETESATAITTTAVPINENLFLEEDLDDLDDELNDLELED